MEFNLICPQAIHNESKQQKIQDAFLDEALTNKKTSEQLCRRCPHRSVTTNNSNILKCNLNCHSF